MKVRGAYEAITGLGVASHIRICGAGEVSSVLMVLIRESI